MFFIITGSIIKLNANENPYGPSPQVGDVLHEFAYSDLNKYPPLSGSSLEKAIAEHYGVDEDNVLSGNSSDEVLAMCFRAFFNSDMPVLFPDITYSFYKVWCDFYGIPFEEIPLTSSLEIDVNDYISRDNGGIVITNPNAPTGIDMGLNVIEELVSRNTASVVIIDEAYVDFADISSVELTKKYDNLLITRTLSKSRSLAGLRVGYAIGSIELINALTAAMHSFNAYPLSSVSIKMAAAAVKDVDYFQATVNKIKETRNNTARALSNMGFRLTDSKTNFLFMTHTRINAKDLYEYLLDKNILVRYFSKERIDGYIRVSVGTDEHMKIFIDSVKEYMVNKNVI